MYIFYTIFSKKAEISAIGQQCCKHVLVLFQAGNFGAGWKRNFEGNVCYYFDNLLGTWNCFMDQNIKIGYPFLHNWTQQMILKFTVKKDLPWFNKIGMNDQFVYSVCGWSFSMWLRKFLIENLCCNHKT